MKKICLFLTAALLGSLGLAQSSRDHEEFENNRRLITKGHSFTPKNGFVPDTNTAAAIAYAVAVPIYGQKEMDEEKPFRAELENGVWTVLGTLHCEDCAGGTLLMQIDEASGKILFLTHTK